MVGLTTVGQAGATNRDARLARRPLPTVLKDLGYATGQFGKNHLGDRNPFLPTLHGFDEFWGYLYHLNGMEDPYFPNYPEGCPMPQSVRATSCTPGPPTTDDPTVDPRWGKVGKQKIVR